MRLKNVPQFREVSISVNTFKEGMNGSVEENVLPLVYAKELINLDSKNGALLPGVGIGQIDEDESIEAQLRARFLALDEPKQLYHFRRVDQNGNRADYVVAYCSGSLIAIDYFNPSNPNKVVWSNLSEVPQAVNYNLNSTDVIIFCFQSGKMIVWDGEEEAYLVADAPAISSLALHYERLFATSNKQEQNTVWFSDDLDPTNWSISLSEAGFIQMSDERGAALRVVSFLDYVYVFREYGIARISGYGDQTQFLVSQLSFQTGKIFADTVTLVGNKILFLAEDGLYSFNGLSVSKILPGLNSYFVGANNLDAVAVAGEGKWFLLCNIMLENEQGQKAQTKVLIEYDAAENKALVGRGLGIVSLCALRLPHGSKVLAVVDKSKAEIFEGGETLSGGSGIVVGEIDHSGALFGDSLLGIWKSAWTDIGYSNAAKIVRKVSLDTKGKQLGFVLSTERGTLDTTIGTASKSTDTKLLNLRGDKIRFVLKGAAKDFYASNLRLSLKLVSR